MAVDELEEEQCVVAEKLEKCMAVEELEELEECVVAEELEELKDRELEDHL
tara:strand:+ start:279 stop:431 length:153 start_codon:yes stop_codon:yes gene_type:complete